MKNSISIVLSLLLLSSSCVKEGGKVSSGNTTTDTDAGGGSNEVPGAPDPLLSQAWHFEDISLVGAALGYTGAGVRIAVSDTGTDIDHEDLTGNQLVGLHRNYGMSNLTLWRSTLPTFGSSNDYIIDRGNAHGTAVSGLIAAEGTNGIGSRGVAPDAKFAAFRYLGNDPTLPILARTIDQLDGEEFDIFNYSYGSSNVCGYTEVDSPLVVAALEAGVTTLRGGLGAIYVQSAGNNFQSDCYGNTNFDENIAYPEKIVVGAVNANGVKSSYSTPGSGIWVSAPGGEDGVDEPALMTTDITGCNHGMSQLTYILNAFNGGRSSDNTQCSYTSLMNGTSAAAPVVSGVIALMLEANPNLTWRDVKHILAMTADPLEYEDALSPLEHPNTDPDPDEHLYYNPPGFVYDYKWVVNDAGIPYSNWYGFGRVNALAAVLEADAYVTDLGTYASVTSVDSPVGEIPEGDAAGTIALPGAKIHVPQNLIIESVQIEVSITHDWPSDLGIYLISPNNTESRLLNFHHYAKPTLPTGKILITNAFYGEESEGDWKLRVVDAFVGDEGTLDNWKITINGHAP